MEKFSSTLRTFVVLACMLALYSCLDGNKLNISCNTGNDLYIVLKNSGIPCSRYDTPADAIGHAPEGSGVMILADGYPSVKTPVDEALYALAREKQLRLYVEYPAFIQGAETGQPRGTHWERGVISSGFFEPRLQKMRILAIHDCRFIPMQVADPDVVVARVAGFDSALFGLPKETFPVLARLHDDENGGLMVASTKLSQFITARYAPFDAWKAIWPSILSWVAPGLKLPELKWSPRVAPSYEAGAQLPGNAEEMALKRGIDWYFRSRLIVHPMMMEKYNTLSNDPLPASADPDTSQPWPYGHRVAKMLREAPAGDGTLGILEGFDAKIFYDGSQPVRWWIRGDCTGEIAGALSVAGQSLDDSLYRNTGERIADWMFFQSRMSSGDRANPGHPVFGLSGWNDVPEYCGPGTLAGYEVYYGDDNARLILGMLLAGAVHQTGKYDNRLMSILLANLRNSSQFGFQQNGFVQEQVVKNGWQKTFESDHVSYSPHFQSYIWACYLWAYQQTGFDLFLQRAKTAIRMMMEAYPDKWIWTNGIQQERARMLLPLAWLIRIEDTAEHRAWLRKMADELLAGQEACGAIREEIGEVGKGGFPPPASNEAYGTSETPLIQTNNDKVSDLLYTTNFAFLGLHEAAAATGDPFYREAENRLAEYLCRIQVRSDNHPELDGAWFRAFDFNRWEYWASSGDAGWGAWSIEAGWTQSWITTILGLRHLKTSVWELTADSQIEESFEAVRRQILP